MFCTSCGFELAEDDLFCTRCGAKQVVTSQESLNLENENESEPIQQEEDMLDASKRVEEVESMDMPEQVVVPEEAKKTEVAGFEYTKEVTSTLDVSSNETYGDKKSYKWLIAIAVAIILVFSLITFLLGNKNGENNIEQKPNKKSEKQSSTSEKGTKAVSGQQKQLPDVDEFEELLEKAVIDFYGEAGIDAITKGYLLKDYEVTDMSATNAEYEHMISCTYGPNKTIGLMANVNNGKVEYVFTYIPLIGMEVDGEDLASMAQMVMVTAGLYDDKYSDLAGKFDLMEKLVDTGIRDEEGDTMTLVLDDIEYSLTVSDTMVSFTVDAKETQKEYEYNDKVSGSNGQNASESTSSSKGNSTQATTNSTSAMQNTSKQNTNTQKETTTHTHTYNSWRYYSNNKHYTMCACGESKYESHGFDGGRVTTQATHKAVGYKEYTCTVCGFKKDEQIPRITEHSYGAWEYKDVDRHSRSCSCSDKQTEMHSWVLDTQNSNSSITAYKCVCSATRTEQNLQPTAPPTAPPTTPPAEAPIAPPAVTTTYKYYCYYAQYMVDENHTGTYYAQTTQQVLDGIASQGGTATGDVQYYEIVTNEYKGEYFERNGLWVYLQK